MQIFVHKENWNQSKTVCSIMLNQLSFKTYFQKVGQHTNGKWLIHGAKTPQGQSVAKPGYISSSFFWTTYFLWSLGGPCDMSQNHYNDVIMGAIASQITSLTIVYSIFYSDADQRKHQSSASLAFVRGINRGPRKMLPFDDVIMCQRFCEISRHCMFPNTDILSTFVILHFVFLFFFIVNRHDEIRHVLSFSLCFGDPWKNFITLNEKFCRFLFCAVSVWSKIQ